MTADRKLYLLIALVGLTVAGTLPALATTIDNGDDVHISSLHEIDDDFYAFSDKIQIDGVITGDVTGFARNIVIRGNVGGSANFAGQFVDHNGTVERSFRFAGDRLTLTGRIGGSLLAAGQTILMQPGSMIEKDVHLGAADVTLDGTVLGNVTCKAARARITAQIGGDLNVTGKEITIAPPAVIRGNLIYNTESEDMLTIEPGVTIVGTKTWKPPEVDEEEKGELLPDIAFAIANLLAAFIFGLLVLKLFRGYTEESFRQLRSRVTASVAAGLIALLALIMAVVVLVLALIGTAIGALLLSGDLAFLGVCLLVVSLLAIPITSFVAVTGAIILYSGKIVVGLVLGYLLFRLRRTESVPATPTKGALFVGLILLSFGSALPYVGTVIYLVTMLIGSGAIVLGIYRCRMICTDRTSA